jgi:DNA-binding transcriptional LysR family regulator
MTNRLSGIQEFVAVVEAGGFAAAGERLGLSRSAVGKAVVRLEGRLGVRLCHRTTRVFNLTDDGQVFYERCLRALRELEAAETAIETGRNEPAGRIRISVPVLFGRRCVVPVLMELARQYPKLDLEASFTDRTVDLVEEGYDLAIRNGPVRDNAGLMMRRVARQRMTICASPRYLEQRGSPATFAEIADHDTVVYSLGGRIRSWRFRSISGESYELPLQSRIKFDDLDAIADAATAGMGLAWLPCWLIRDRVRDGELVPVLRDIDPLVFDSSALWPRTPHLPTRMRLLIDTLAARLPGMTG